MTNVVLFPRHRLHKCRSDCEGCFVCSEGFAVCKTCGGSEASLPTHCPQSRMDGVMLLTVQQGTADFFNGEWRWLGLTSRECFDG